MKVVCRKMILVATLCVLLLPPAFSDVKPNRISFDAMRFLEGFFLEDKSVLLPIEFERVFLDGLLGVLGEAELSFGFDKSFDVHFSFGGKINYDLPSDYDNFALFVSAYPFYKFSPAKLVLENRFVWNSSVVAGGTYFLSPSFFVEFSGGVRFFDFTGVFDLGMVTMVKAGIAF